MIVVFVYPETARRLPRTARTEALAHIVYRQRKGVLRTILAACTREGFAVTGIHTREDEPGLIARDAVEVTLELRGAGNPIQLAASLHELDGILEARTTDTDDDGD